MANLNDFTAEFEGVDEAIQQQQGAVFNLPPGYETPSSQSTTAAIDIWETPNYVPPGNFSLYEADASAEVFRQETAEIEGLIAATPPFAPNPIDPNTNEPLLRVDVSGYERPQQPLVNPLHDYDSYTYNLSLHAITVADYNNLADNPNGYQPSNVLIAGAGKYSDSFRRNAYFQEDFYFENLRMRSVINTTKVNRFSNVTNLEFSIIEPNGFTLIQRLVSACEAPVSQGGVGGQNYLKQPFILQIDFYGSTNNEIGLGIIPNQTKLIPIRLTKMTVKMSTRGAVYSIQAAPYNHNAFDPTKIVLPALFTIKAAKVQDVFSSSTVDQGAADIETRTAIENQEYNSTIAEYRNLADAFGPDTQVAQAKPSVIGTQGLAAGYNSYYNVNEQKYGTKHDRIRFALDPEIGNSLLYETGTADVSSAATTGNAQTATQQAGGANKGSIAFNAGVVSIPAGTNIQSVIEWAISNSEYMRKQVYGIKEASPKNQLQSEVPLQLVKVVPRVRILEYDPIRDNYRYEITYNIRKFFVNSRSPHAPQGRVKGWVKEYNYIYTGGVSPYTGDNASNRDVLDLQIDFNALFYTTITAFKEKSKTMQTGKTQANSGDNVTLMGKEASGFAGDPGNVENTQDQNPAKAVEDRISRAEVYYTAGNKMTQSKGGGSQVVSVAAADILNNQLLTAQGDMLNVRLKITGDPHFIKQDDILYNQNIVAAQSLLTPNNSLYTDSGELYVFLTFRSPIDYDETTGLAIPSNNPFSYSLFTGVYKILEVESLFSQGQFTQELKLARLAISDENRLKEFQAAFRRENAFEIGTGQNIRFPLGQNLGQRIAGTLFSGGLLNGGLEQAAASIVQKVFNEKVQPVIVQEIGRLTENIFGNPAADLFDGIDNFDLDFNAVPALEDFELTQEISSLYTDVNNFDFEFDSFDFDGLSDAFGTEDIDYLGSWL